VRISGRNFRILVVRDTNALIDAIDPVRFADDDRLPYWAELWPSAIELARYCLRGSPYRGKRVLELGCGVGLAGIAAAQSGATVTMTDVDEDALLFARWNASVNLEPEILLQNVHMLRMDWRAPECPGKFDAVIGSDILYERPHFEPVLDILENHLATDGCATFTDPGRQTGVGFRLRAEERGFAVHSHRRVLGSERRPHAIVTFSLRRKEAAQ